MAAKTNGTMVRRIKAPAPANSVSPIEAYFQCGSICPVSTPVARCPFGPRPRPSGRGLPITGRLCFKLTALKRRLGVRVPNPRTNRHSRLWRWFDQIDLLVWCEEEGHAGHIRRRTPRQRSNLVKSRRDAAHFASERRCKRLEVADTTAPFAPSQQPNGPRQRHNREC